MGAVWILLGPPGAGKGTQADRLSAECSVPHVATGDLFREHLRHGTDLGARARVYMDKGELVPDELVLEMLFERVSHPDCAERYLLDGFPRTLAQAETLQNRLQQGGWSVRAISLDVSDATLVERMSGRLTCSGCGKAYHVRLQPPRTSGQCDRCSAALVRRSDDEPGVVGRRLEVYRRETAPLLDFYRSRGLLQRVDGEGSADKIFARLRKSVAGGEAA